MDVLGTDRAGLYASGEGLDAVSARRFERTLCHRCAGTPLQHLTGNQQFFDLVLAVEPGVFVPRPETEGVVEAALAALEGVPGPSVVDVGTGTGAVALAIKRFRPDATVWATDSSARAVDLARANADRLGLDVAVRHGDLLDPLDPGLEGGLDLVVSNPPYVTEEALAALPPEVRADPIEALVGGTTVHRRLAEAAPRWLRPDRWLVMEIGEEQGAEVRALLEVDFIQVEILPDLAGRDRVARGRLA
jgi:release factor glutamine methyltransferase